MGKPMRGPHVKDLKNCCGSATFPASFTLKFLDNNSAIVLQGSVPLGVGRAGGETVYSAQLCDLENCQSGEGNGCCITAILSCVINASGSTPFSYGFYLTLIDNMERQAVNVPKSAANLPRRVTAAVTMNCTTLHADVQMAPFTGMWFDSSSPVGPLVQIR